MVPIDAGFRDFLDEVVEVGDRREMHLEVRDGHMVAVDDSPGGDIVPVVWDDGEKRYLIVPPE
ncbi:MAG: hypothetical protein M3Q23_02130 [Actinomycetota bacterium]|nr:hypothetical protein [Actinomycetota bacterium]